MKRAANIAVVRLLGLSLGILALSSAHAGPLETAISACRTHARQFAGEKASIGIRSIKKGGRASLIRLYVRGSSQGSLECRVRDDGELVSVSFKDETSGKVTDLIYAEGSRPRH